MERRGVDGVRARGLSPRRRPPRRGDEPGPADRRRDHGRGPARTSARRCCAEPPAGDNSTMQFHLNGYAPGDPRVAGCASVGRGAADRACPESRRPDRRGGPAGLVLAAQLANFPEIGPRSSTVETAARRSGRPTGRVPHRGDVRGVRTGRASCVERGLLGQRGLLLAAGPRGPDQDQAHRPRRGHRGGTVGVPARDRQPGAHARLPARAHGALAQPARRRSTACSVDRGRRRTTTSP